MEREVMDDYENIGTPNSILLREVKSAGFNPIGITEMIGEETFIFKGIAEAKAAAKKFLPEGWWYEFTEWLKFREEYIEKAYNGDKDFAPVVYWLDENYKPK